MPVWLDIWRDIHTSTSGLEGYHLTIVSWSKIAGRVLEPRLSDVINDSIQMNDRTLGEPRGFYADFYDSVVAYTRRVARKFLIGRDRDLDDAVQVAVIAVNNNLDRFDPLPLSQDMVVLRPLLQALLKKNIVIDENGSKSEMGLLFLQYIIVAPMAILPVAEIYGELLRQRSAILSSLQNNCSLEAAVAVSSFEVAATQANIEALLTDWIRLERSFKKWLAMVATNAIRDYLRQNQPVDPLPEFDIVDTASDIDLPQGMPSRLAVLVPYIHGTRERGKYLAILTYGCNDFEYADFVHCLGTYANVTHVKHVGHIVMRQLLIKMETALIEGGIANPTSHDRECLLDEMDSCQRLHQFRLSGHPTAWARLIDCIDHCPKSARHSLCTWYAEFAVLYRSASVPIMRWDDLLACAVTNYCGSR